MILSNVGIQYLTTLYGSAYAPRVRYLFRNVGIGRVSASYKGEKVREVIAETPY